MSGLKAGCKEVLGLPLDRVEIEDDGDAWSIRRRLTHAPLTSLAQEEPGAPGLLITPGVNPEMRPDMVPAIVRYPKHYGGLGEVMGQLLDKIDEKEAHCPICKKAKEQVERYVAGVEMPPDVQVELPRQEPEEVELPPAAVAAVGTEQVQRQGAPLRQRLRGPGVFRGAVKTVRSTMSFRDILKEVRSSVLLPREVLAPSLEQKEE